MKTELMDTGVLLTPENETDQAYLFRLVTAPAMPNASPPAPLHLMERGAARRGEVAPDAATRRALKKPKKKKAPAAGRKTQRAPRETADGSLLERIAELFTPRDPVWKVADLAAKLNVKGGDIHNHIAKVPTVEKVGRGLYRLVGSGTGIPADGAAAENDGQTHDDFEKKALRFLRANGNLTKTSLIAQHLREAGVDVSVHALVMGLRSLPGVKAMPDGYWKYEGKN